MATHKAGGSEEMFRRIKVERNQPFVIGRAGVPGREPHGVLSSLWRTNGSGFGHHRRLVHRRGQECTSSPFGVVASFWAASMTPVYREATVGRVRRWIEGADDRVYTGDPAKLARASFDTTTSAPPPLRLTLGSDAYDFVHKALQDRLATLEAQEVLARSMAFSGQAG
jgi:hypothetical protein